MPTGTVFQSIPLSCQRQVLLLNRLIEPVRFSIVIYLVQFSFREGMKYPHLSRSPTWLVTPIREAA